MYSGGISYERLRGMYHAVRAAQEVYDTITGLRSQGRVQILLLVRLKIWNATSTPSGHLSLQLRVLLVENSFVTPDSRLSATPKPWHPAPNAIEYRRGGVPFLNFLLGEAAFPFGRTCFNGRLRILEGPPVRYSLHTLSFRVSAPFANTTTSRTAAVRLLSDTNVQLLCHSHNPDLHRSKFASRLK